jgi:hypothetical protein
MCMFCDDFSVTNMLGDMYYFEIILFHDMYHLRIYHLMTYCYVTHSLSDILLNSCIMQRT